MSSHVRRLCEALSATRMFAKVRFVSYKESKIWKIKQKNLIGKKLTHLCDNSCVFLDKDNENYAKGY